MNNKRKQLLTIELIWLLIKSLFRDGNVNVFYNICGFPDCWDCPMEVERIEIRKTQTGDKITII